jgi:hypothetical protein
MTAFQTQVNANQAPAVEGDWASANPRGSVLAGEGALVAGRGVDGGVSVAGIIMGRFGWLSFAGVDNDEAPAVVNTFGFGQPAGFVHREQIGYITTYLGEASLVMPSGKETALFNNCDIWIKNRGATYAQYGMKAFANYADGTAYFAAAGSTPPGGSGSTSSIAAGTFSATGSILDNIMTVTGAVTGANGIVAGGTISGTGVATGSKVLGQVTPLLAGEAIGGIGRYYVSIPEQSAASTTISGTYGILTVAGTVTGTYGIGQPISGTNVVAGTTIFSQLTGTAGGAGTYVVDNNTVVSSTAITSQNAVETKWYCKSGGATGEIVKVSDTL